MYQFDKQQLAELAAQPDSFKHLIEEFRKSKVAGASQAEMLAGLEAIMDLLDSETASDLYECIMGYAYPDLTEDQHE